MVGFNVIPVVRKLKTRYVSFTTNEVPETTPLVTATARFPQKNDRYYNALIILVYYAVGIGIIVLGTSYINNCPAEKMLPIGLIIFGGIFVVSRLLLCVYDLRGVLEEEHVEEDIPYWLIILTILLSMAQLGIFFSVFYWWNNVDIDEANKDPQNYCDPTLIRIVSCGIIAGIFVLLNCLCTCYFYSVRSEE